MSPYSRAVKRVFDLMLAAPALILLAPLLAALALLVRLCLGSPVLFRQQRPGWRGKPFWIRKFRTMTDARDAQGQLLPDSVRVTPVGRFLRRTSLDELPTLLNVLRGEMSLVGPRPLLMEYLDRYTPEQARRHEVRPGITGWAQINGRNETVFSQRLKLDTWYVDHVSLLLDCKIIFRTFSKALSASGVRLERLEDVDDIGLHPRTKRCLAARED